MPAEQNPGATGPDDDFDRQLRDLTSGAAGQPAFREPSARERAGRAEVSRPGSTSWRQARKARKLRKPVDSAAQPRLPLRRRQHLQVVGGTTARQRPAGPLARRLRSAAKAVVIIAGFIALLVLLHLIGLGPQ